MSGRDARRSQGGRSQRGRSRRRHVTPLPHRRLVLDATAAGALVSTEPHDARRAAVLLAIAAADAGVAVPTSVRVEVGWDRRDPAWSNANRLVGEDDVLDTATADTAAASMTAQRRLHPVDTDQRRASRSPSVVDGHVAVAAHRRAAAAARTAGGEEPGVVEVLTADVAHVRSVLDVLPREPRTPVEVHRI